MATWIRSFRSLKRPRSSGLVHAAVNNHGAQLRVVAVPFHHSLYRSYATESPATTSSNPVLEKYLNADSLPTAPKEDAGQQQQRRLPPSSIFNSIVSETDKETGRNAAAMAARLDPQPTQRRRWERKMVIQEIRRRGRVSKPLKLKRTERQLLSKSDFWRTSVKKLMFLARQIQGKPIDEAIAQMRFSKKKTAAFIHDHLLAAKDRAVVERGMGLGEAGSAKWIKLKDGTMHRVQDKTSIYIDQAWVGRGSFGRDFMKRARSKWGVLRLPQTSISVLLKEEKTRIRLHEEAKEKARSRKPWVQLPDRPIPTQRPYYSW